MFEALLGRKPQAAEVAVISASPSPMEYVTNLPEYRNRFRDAVHSDDNARASLALWPPESRDLSVHIVLASGDDWQKTRATAERLAGQLVPGTFLTVLCGEHSDEPWDPLDRVELHEHDGLSVFELRALIPTILREASWVALVEDHAFPAEGWMAAVLEAIPNIGTDVMAFTGTASNEVSSTPWGWANFLFNFTDHFHPSASDQLPGTVTTSFFRRDVVGSRPLRLFQLERDVLSRTGPVINTVRVDHVQHTGWWTASTHVFDNGRVAGASIRRLADAPRSEIFGMVKFVMGERLAHISRVLRAHAKREALPHWTVQRIWWIGLCHSAGALFGAIVGGGDAPKRLE